MRSLQLAALALLAGLAACGLDWSVPGRGPTGSGGSAAEGSSGQGDPGAGAGMDQLPPSPICEDCAFIADQNECYGYLVICSEDPDCSKFAECVSGCGPFHPSCLDPCSQEMPPPSSYVDLVNCRYCVSCTDRCPELSWLCG